MKSGAEPNQVESDHALSALHILVDAPYKGQTISEKQRAELIRLLVAKGANVDLPDKHQMGPIHKYSSLSLEKRHSFLLCRCRVVINDRVECLDALIEASVDPNLSFLGETALSIAARQNRDKIMKKLLDYPKTKSDVKNESGGTVLHFAAAGSSLSLSLSLINDGCVD